MTVTPASPGSAVHTTFTIERQLKADPKRAFRAWADPASKQKWFACHGDWTTLEYRLDFRAGGSERNYTADGDGLNSLRIRFPLLPAASFAVALNR